MKCLTDLVAKGFEHGDACWSVLVGETSPNPAGDLKSLSVNDLLQHVLLKVGHVFVPEGKPLGVIKNVL